MVNLQSIDLKVLIATAQSEAAERSLIRVIGSFGAWAMDANKNPTVFQVQVIIQDCGGEFTRKESGYYFIPTTQPNQALAIAKALATYDFINEEYPSVKVEEKKEVYTDVTESKPVETKNDTREEVKSEAQVPKSEDKPAGKKRGGKRASAETAPVTEVAPAETPEESAKKSPPAPSVEAYDRTKPTHKDAFIMLLDKIDPNWRKMGKEKSQAMSSTLAGKPFMESNSGVILEQFKVEVQQYVQQALA